MSQSSFEVLELFSSTPAEEDVEVMVNEDDLESLEDAALSCCRELASLSEKRRSVLRRWHVLTTGAGEVRRRRGRNYLDAFIPPIQFYSIEEATD